ncbi:MAG TPA: efflux RND transporter periplasmic adaptor subunit, partial [Flavobacterium sp.]
AAVDEADIGGIQSGQKVTFTVDAFPDDVFQGKVQEVLLHPSVSANVVTYKTLINVDNTTMKLKPGMTASIYIYTEEDPNALMIPSGALNFKPDSTLASRYVVVPARRGQQDSSEKRNFKKEPPGKSTSVNGARQKAYVWKKSGDTLLEKAITIGLNDDVSVKVIKGLSPNEEVITRAEIGESKDSGAQRSPFMPKMQRRGTGGPR